MEDHRVGRAVFFDAFHTLDPHRRWRSWTRSRACTPAGTAPHSAGGPMGPDSSRARTVACCKGISQRSSSPRSGGHMGFRADERCPTRSGSRSRRAGLASDVGAAQAVGGRDSRRRASRQSLRHCRWSTRRHRLVRRPDHWPVGIAYFMLCALDIIDRRNWSARCCRITSLASRRRPKRRSVVRDAWFLYRCATFYRR